MDRVLPPPPSMSFSGLARESKGCDLSRSGSRDVREARGEQPDTKGLSYARPESTEGSKGVLPRLLPTVLFGQRNEFRVIPIGLEILVIILVGHLLVLVVVRYGLFERSQHIVLFPQQS